jgi:hypothetical protein
MANSKKATQTLKPGAGFSVTLNQQYCDSAAFTAHGKIFAIAFVWLN